MFKRIVAAFALALGMHHPAAAQDTTIDRIVNQGVLRVATSYSTPPYGIVDENLQPAGFDVEIARLIARDLGVELELVDVSSAARIPGLTGGTVDLVISSFGVTAERAKVVMFSNAIYVDTQTVLAPKDTEFNTYEDLVGRRIGVTRGSTNDVLLTENALPGTEILRFDDAAGGNQALFSGQVEGLVSGTAAAFTIARESDAFEAKFPMRTSPMGIGVRQGDFALLQWLNTEIMMLWNSGELQAAQRKWIGSVNEDLPDYWF